MNSAPIPYQRLPGRGANLISYSRLYQGPDHLLLVRTTGYNETYKRFFFQDIQVILVQRTATGAALNWTFSLLTALCAILWLLEAKDGFASDAVLLVMAGILTALCIVPLLANLLRGPTCACHVRTAVQIEKLPNVKRLRTAQKIIRRLKPLIESAQGSLSPGEFGGAGSGPGTGSPAAAADLASPPAIGSTPLVHNQGRLHRVLSWLLLADLPSTGFALLGASWTHIPGMILLPVTGIAAIMAAVKQRGSDLPPALRLLPWLTLVALGVHQMLGVVYGIYLGAQGKTSLIIGLSTLNDPVLRMMAIVSTSLSVLLGCFGLIQLKQHRPPAPSPPALENPPSPPA